MIYHDNLDEQIDGSDWIDEEISCPTILFWHASEVETDPFANTIRWGTSYSFSYLHVPPAAFEPGYGITLGRTNGSGLVEFNAGAIYPGIVTEPCICLGDLAEPFGVLNFFDVSAFLGAYGAQDPNVDFAEPFGTFNFFDVSVFLSAFAAGCP